MHENMCWRTKWKIRRFSTAVNYRKRHSIERMMVFFYFKKFHHLKCFVFIFRYLGLSILRIDCFDYDIIGIVGLHRSIHFTVVPSVMTAFRSVLKANHHLSLHRIAYYCFLISACDIDMGKKCDCKKK